MNQIVTYSSIEESFLSFLFRQNSSKQIVKNYRSALKSWRESFGFLPDEPVGNEWSSEFTQFCSDYRRKLQPTGIKYSTVASRLSRIKKIRGFYLQSLKDLDLPNSFNGRLSHFVKLRGFNAAGFVETFLRGRIAIPTFRMWCAGTRVPRRNKYKLIKDTEAILDIPAGMLLSRLGWREPFIKKSEIKKSGKLNSQYRLLTEQLAAECEEIKKFHTAVIPAHDLNRSVTAVWTSTEGAEYPAAAIFENKMKSLAGFCALPENSSDPKLSGLGMKKEDITLGLFAEPDVIEKYLTVFKLARSGGKYNNYHINFLSIVTAALREGTGYIYQKPEFAAKLKLNLTTEEWQQKCVTARRRLLELKAGIINLKKSGSGEFELGRDPSAPLAAILSLHQPLTVTLKMVADMISDVNNLSLPARPRACLFRDALLAALLQANPLRVRMFSIMKFGENLVREDDGSWWFKFKRNTFKNRRALKSDYYIKLAPETWNIIERYKSEFRPVFKNAENNQYVFLNFADSNQKAGRISTSYLSQIIRKRTRQYIPGCPGFGVHAYRYIVATSIVKNSPSGLGMFLAAKVLQDKLDTVEESYAHLRTNDYIEPYNTFFSDLWGGLSSETDKRSEKDNTPPDNSAKNGGAE